MITKLSTGPGFFSAHTEKSPILKDRVGKGKILVLTAKIEAYEVEADDDQIKFENIISVIEGCSDPKLGAKALLDLAITINKNKHILSSIAN